MKKLNYLLFLIIFFDLHAACAQSATKKDIILIKDPITHCAYRYHYYPNLEAYYDTKENIYIFSQKGEWIRAAEIPSGYRGYSLNNKVNVVITDYDDDDPTQFIKIHKKKYPYNFHPKSKELTFNQ